MVGLLSIGLHWFLILYECSFPLLGLGKVGTPRAMFSAACLFIVPKWRMAVLVFLRLSARATVLHGVLVASRTHVLTTDSLTGELAIGRMYERTELVAHQ